VEVGQRKREQGKVGKGGGQERIINICGGKLFLEASEKGGLWKGRH